MELRKGNLLIPAAALALLIAGVVAQGVLSQRTYLRAVEEGMRLYARGDLPHAEAGFREALRRKPESVEARDLLINTLVDLGVKRYKEKDFPGALVPLREALEMTPPDHHGRKALV